jgi:hypothetical protein
MIKKSPTTKISKKKIIESISVHIVMIILVWTNIKKQQSPRILVCEFILSAVTLICGGGGNGNGYMNH